MENFSNLVNQCRLNMNFSSITLLLKITWETLNPCMRAYSSPNTKTNNNKQKNIKRQMSGVMCHLSPATCHLSVMPTAQSQTLPLLTPPLCTVGLFAKTKKLRFFSPLPLYSINIFCFQDVAYINTVPLVQT